MANQNNAAAVLDALAEGGGEVVCSGGIEVVGGFVEEEEVGGGLEDGPQREVLPLPAREPI